MLRGPALSFSSTDGRWIIIPDTADVDRVTFVPASRGGTQPAQMIDVHAAASATSYGMILRIDHAIRLRFYRPDD